LARAGRRGADFFAWPLVAGGNSKVRDEDRLGRQVVLDLTLLLDDDLEVADLFAVRLQVEDAVARRGFAGSQRRPAPGVIPGLPVEDAAGLALRLGLQQPLLPAGLTKASRSGSSSWVR
jgi:hypothetical protein